MNYRSLRMDSFGGYVMRVNAKGTICINEASLIFTHYPDNDEGNFICSDKLLNKIYEVGKHTVRICRQSIELDSPFHQENLGCVGDYFIQSLIAYYLFEDKRLSRFDILRIANYMRMSKGKLFHTSYSLIWTYMLYDYYMFSGDKSILYEVSDVLKILFDRFNSYVGETGVLENVPNYMFIDWISVDEYNLHHPPKALGQSTLTAFYYQALCIGNRIFKILKESKLCDILEERAQKIKEAFNNCFYDEERCLYFNGLNTPSKVNKWLPKNTSKRYYSKHPNILAVLFDLCDNKKEIMEKVINDKELIDVQPYFMHFKFEALYKAGLFEKYGLDQIRRWKSLVEECDKGMKEAWGDYSGYKYDYSHAWSATPTYQLPSKLLGLKIIEPGFKKISLTPNLYGLKFAHISVPTPYGNLECKLGEKNEIKIPEGICLT